MKVIKLLKLWKKVNDNFTFNNLKDNQEMVEILKRKEMEIDKLHKQLDDRKF